MTHCFITIYLLTPLTRAIAREIYMIFHLENQLLSSLSDTYRSFFPSLYIQLKQIYIHNTDNSFITSKKLNQAYLEIVLSSLLKAI